MGRGRRRGDQQDGLAAARCPAGQCVRGSLRRCSVRSVTELITAICRSLMQTSAGSVSPTWLALRRMCSLRRGTRVTRVPAVMNPGRMILNISICHHATREHLPWPFQRMIFPAPHTFSSISIPLRRRSTKSAVDTTSSLTTHRTRLQSCRACSEPRRAVRDRHEHPCPGPNFHNEPA